MSRLEQVLGCFIVLCGALLFAHSAMSASNPAQRNSCVQCHSKLPASSFYGVKSHSWTGSVHQMHGVTCDKCHGGNPAAAQENQAHIGMLGSSDPHSTIYFKNIPATCGKCHGAEFYKFTQSVHYQMLESTGKGPECVTCHGSMVTKVLRPDDMVAVCARCHNERMAIAPYVPQKAKAVLLLLGESKALLADQERLHPAPRSAGTAQSLDEAGIALHNAKLDWHKFDLDAITKYLLEFYDTVEKLPRAPASH
ncbi:MAG: multiheme c-type cytochrome [Syntrophobacteraceae bacterium]|nr:multiheme c-type cytochrome [Syntrophobacteraceae bacterium]